MLPRLNEELDAFVDNHINNFVKWDLVVFFHQNPDLADTPEAIAGRLGRREADVTAALDDLVESNILERQMTDRARMYRYLPGGPEQALVSEFVTALDSREQRLQILTKLLRLGARG